MKKTRRIAAFAAAMAMAATMAMPMAMTSSAAGSISIKNAVEAHTYQAYQIFGGELSATDGTLAKVVWGTGVDSTKLIALVDAIQAISITTVTDGVSTTVTPFSAVPDYNATADKSAAEIAKVLAGITNENDPVTKAFAKEVGKRLSTTCVESSFADGIHSISGTADGYFLVKDKDTSLKNLDDAYTSYIIQVLGTQENIVPKSAKPEVIKKVQENNNDVEGDVTINSVKVDAASTKWNDVADYSVGDSVPFKLYGTMPSNLNDYNHYYYKFVDTLGPEFTIDRNTVFTISVINGTTVTKVNANRYNIHIKTTTDTTGTTIGIEIEDIKALTTFAANTDGDSEPIEVNSSSIITVEYNAVLNENAKIGLPGQVNEVKLDYSNNPNEEYVPKTDTPNTTEVTEGAPEGDTPEGPETENKPEAPSIPGDEETPDVPANPSTPSSPEYPSDNGETPIDKVIVFTYAIDATKVDGVNTATKLGGAEFLLKKSATEYAKINDGVFAGWVTKADATKLVSDSTTGKFVVKGLDEGSYILEETKAPTNYDLPSNPDFPVVITAETNNNQSWAFDGEASQGSTALTNIYLGSGDSKVEQDTEKHGTVSAQIKNSKGSTLPTTGGMGTRLFVLGGGCMAGLAGLYLVSKKRSKDAE